MLSSIKHRLSLFLLLAAFFLFLYTTLPFVKLCWDYLQYPYELDRAEGCILTYLYFWKNYGTYFFNLLDYPHTYAAYPPLFVWISLLLSKISLSLLQATRLTSILFSWLLIFLIYRIIFQETRARFFAAVFALGFSSLLFFQIFAPLGRIDTMTIFFSLAGLYTFQIYSEKDSKKRYWAFLFFILAFLTKQNSILAPLSIFLYEITIKKNRRILVPYLSIYFLPILLLIAGLNFYTDGEFIKHIFIYTGQRHLRFMQIIDGHYIFLTHMPMFVVMFLLIFTQNIWRSMKSKTQSIYMIYAVLNFFWIINIGVIHSSTNYLLEPAVALVVAGALASHMWMQIEEEKKNFYLRSTLCALLLCVQALVSFFHIKDYQETLLPRYFMGPHFKNAEQTSRTLDRMIRITEGDILCAEFSLLIFHDRPVFFGCPPPIVEQGKLKLPKLVQDCRDQRFRLIIADDQLLRVQGMAECLEEKYVPFSEGDVGFTSPHRIRNYFLFLPKPDQEIS